MEARETGFPMAEKLPGVESIVYSLDLARALLVAIDEINALG